MKRAATAAMLVATGTLWILGSPLQQAQQTRPPVPSILNLLPVTDNLERAEQFYHRLLGLESPTGDPRARLVWYSQVPFLDDMYGVKGNSRNFYVRVPGSTLTLEIEQFSGATGKKLNTHLQDPGAMQLIFTTNNITALTNYLTKGGAKVLSTGGAPVLVGGESGEARAILFQDFNGFFVQLVQPDNKPPQRGGNNAPPNSFITGVTIGVTVDDSEKTARFYHDVLGVDVEMGAFVTASKQLEVFGMKNAQYRESVVGFPEGTPQLHFFEFKGVPRQGLHPLVADPNSILIRTTVRDMDSVVTRVRAAGGQIMNVSGGPTVNGRSRWLVVTDPNGAHLQLLER